MNRAVSEKVGSIPHIQDSDMVELAGQVLGKLETMSDAEFAEVALEAAE